MNAAKWVFGLLVVIAAWPLAKPTASNGQTVVVADETPLKVDAAMRMQVLETLAKELEARYVFPEMGKKMAELLRAKVKDDEYAALDTAKKLCRQLQTELQELSKDRHVRIDWSVKPMPKPSQDEPSQEERKRMREMAARRNGGFVKVERLAGNVGYFDLRGFMQPQAVAEPLAAAMNFLANTDALIIDLRKNGGGSPRGVQLVCSYLFPPEPSVHLNSLYWREGDRTEDFWTLKDVAGKRFADQPVYVLTSKFTFSGAEECAYNLQTRKRATIVGETTGGGAHPGGGHPIGEHFMAFIPTGRAINPVTKTNWEGTGVKPDVEADADQALDTAHKLAIEKLRESIKDPEQLKALNRDLEMENNLNRRYADRKAVRN